MLIEKVMVIISNGYVDIKTQIIRIGPNYDISTCVWPHVCLIQGLSTFFGLFRLFKTKPKGN